MQESPITIDILKDMASNGLVDKIEARQLPDRSGYYLIAHAGVSIRVLHKSRHPESPRIFKSIDAIADNCRELRLNSFLVIDLTD